MTAAETQPSPGFDQVPLPNVQSKEAPLPLPPDVYAGNAANSVIPEIKALDLGQVDFAPYLQDAIDRTASLHARGEPPTAQGDNLFDDYSRSALQGLRDAVNSQGESGGSTAPAITEPDPGLLAEAQERFETEQKRRARLSSELAGHAEVFSKSNTGGGAQFVAVTPEGNEGGEIRYGFGPQAAVENYLRDSGYLVNSPNSTPIPSPFEAYGNWEVSGRHPIPQDGGAYVDVVQRPEMTSVDWVEAHGYDDN